MCPPLLQGVPQLALCLTEEREDHIIAATAWSLGQIGCHTSEHAKTVVLSNVLPKLLEFYMDTSSSEDLKDKVSSRLPSETWGQQFSCSSVLDVFTASYVDITGPCAS